MPVRLPIVALLAALAVGCADTQTRADNPLEYTENAKRAYELALEAYFDRDWEYATQLLEDVRRQYGYSRYARLAELRLADAAFHQEKFAEAIGAYKSFVSDYPNDPEVPYARYKIARAYFIQSGDSSLSLLHQLRRKRAIAVAGYLNRYLPVVGLECLRRASIARVGAR